ncbi:type III-B CRISPR-associated protein Cas10/Cmr2 [Laspinema olomoucense]|uniref:type III-B CRISPR-associated protein Cas10/Cmr2 n=1 Tax=Laspinema olomoucense TaxID=3231600 RepID=UPI0021BA497C|nr:type III-B CRISPR-associated protein Cas10/Cmr2 [Laspinema sp. D3a]MCT7987607.1 type III-B CRISPR-associated protein Cas10/Cmr2 [Laspinema sp. D3a]
MTDTKLKITAALAWCLAWGDERESLLPLPTLQKMQNAILNGQEVPAETREIVQQIKKLDGLSKRLDSLPFPSLADIKKDYPELWQQQTAIGLVYGGATKIKGYVFEASNLQDIRGASALLDRINLVDLPAFFGKVKDHSASQWLDKNFSGLKEALIPELIIYSTGGNILAFCPAAFVDDLANAIEKRYTEETLTANSCAVGASFRLLEIRLGLLKDPIEETFWLEDYRKNYQQPLVKAYFGSPKTDAEAEIVELFKNRKSFNELAGKLASLFQQRRNGNDVGKGSRPSRRYPPIFETHPYVVRDENQQRSAIARTTLPGEPWFSDTLARKRIVGQRVKREGSPKQEWYNKNRAFHWEFGSLKQFWNSGKLESWVLKFSRFLKQENLESNYYENSEGPKAVKEAIRMGEIGNASNDFVAFIYADGNNMGGYIQKIKSPEEYAEFSKDVFKATEQSVYRALAKHLRPHQLKGLTESDSKHREDTWIHPFEIIAIGGDDVMLIVPANQALAIAQTIGEEFEKILLANNKTTYQITEKDMLSNPVTCHRYQDPQNPPQPSQCQLSMSTGVLITSYSTPIYYAEKLTNQLLKSAKKKAKTLKEDFCYHGGTIDILTLKSVTMISSNIQEFRENGLTKEQGKQTLKLYGAPYTLYEVGGLIETIAALKESEFPRSQLYQIRSFLEQGKRTAILNYLYFRSRLKPEKEALLKKQFDNAWCPAKTNNGNIAPWMYESEDKVYETIWREMVDLYPFINGETVGSSQEGDREGSLT